tara:strand:- start:2057 stop:5344 length:3288 start_codon:yes stop_codon:yes gene_type:complete
MAEQVFRSPGFFEREIDLSQREQEVVGVPAGVVGTSEMGPAFIPVTLGSFSDFKARFGDLDPTMAGPYAVNEFLKNRTAVTFLRVLGAGANDTAGDIAVTMTAGTVKNAGFIIKGTTSNVKNSIGHNGAVQFICAQHYMSGTIRTGSATGYPIFADNNSFTDGNRSNGKHLNLVRAMLFTPTGSCFGLVPNIKGALNATANFIQPTGSICAYPLGRRGAPLNLNEFKLVLSTSANSAGKQSFNDEGHVGIRIYTASLDPSSDNYISKILNTDPALFEREQHLLYADFAVEDEVATTHPGVMSGTIAILSGSSKTSSNAGIASLAFRDAYGRFDTRYSNAQTTPFISQPYGSREYDLFHFETISDGANVSAKYKVSISNIRKSTDKSNPFGTFTVLVRTFHDSDTNPEILEQYHQCSLDPSDDGYVAKKIGDLKVTFNFDATSASERRFVSSGKYANVSQRVRIVMNPAVENRDIPGDALPFGFRGLPSLKTNDKLTDSAISWSTTATKAASAAPLSASMGGRGLGSMTPARLAAPLGGVDEGPNVGYLDKGTLTGSIVPPVPFLFKQTRGNVTFSDATMVGTPGSSETVDGRYYWGIKVTRVPRTGTLAGAILNANASSEINPLLTTYTKMLGIQKLDLFTTGSGADNFNNNKFTLCRVALGMTIKSGSSLGKTVDAHLTGTAAEHILETAYLRNRAWDPNDYTVSDPTANQIKRVTFGSLLSLTSSVEFNRFTDYAKFTNIFYGGFDGLNILDLDMSRMNDLSSTSDTGGKASLESPAANTALDIGLSGDMKIGTGKFNNIIASYRAAAEIMTDEMTTRINIFAIPGIRDSFVTDYVIDRIEAFGQAIYLLDIANYDSDNNRIYLDSKKKPAVSKTISQFESRALNTNYAATYFPDVSIIDDSTGNPVKVPASVTALGALGFNDSVSYPWFAPAGFNRASLANVVNTQSRLTAGDRDNLYDARINPIASFPGAGFVIFGQKTLQQARSSLDRVNVRRMLLEVKRIVGDIANTILFEQNTPQTRARFISQVTPQLALIQNQQGVDQFRVVMDNTNNTQEDVESNRLNGRIVLVPTRAVEFIAIDFIITTSGVSFD